MKSMHLDPGMLKLEHISRIYHGKPQLIFPESAYSIAQESHKEVSRISQKDASIYGINTGFGHLANQKIAKQDLNQLQRNLILSHACGVSDPLPNEIVRLIIVLKLATFLQGYSGVSLELIKRLEMMYQKDILPIIPCKGSVGASGDLAPLAHLACFLLGEGQASYEGKTYPAQIILNKLGIKPYVFKAKEGLAFLNGTQVSTALAVSALIEAKQSWFHAILAGAMTVEAGCGSHQPFDSRIHTIRQSFCQQHAALLFRQILAESALASSHQNCDRVQDPYSLRCQPQVMGACLQSLLFAEQVLTKECNAVTDNPLVFVQDQEILSGGNFHGQNVSMACDQLAIALCEIGSLSERRIAYLTTSNMSQLPPFLVPNSGMHSGFMIAHVTATALVSENKTLAHPASIDSIPSSANQEDHVSMATFAARRLHTMLENIKHIIAIEFLASANGLEFRRPLQSSACIEAIHQTIRTHIPSYMEDRYLHDDINAMQKLIASKALIDVIENIHKVSFENLGMTP